MSTLKTINIAHPTSGITNLTLGSAGQVSVTSDLTIGGNYNITGTLTLGSALSVANGGTGASTASSARTNLGLTSLATTSPGTGVATALGNAVNGASGLMVQDSNSNASLAGTLAMGSSFLRNRLINGGMDIWQRGTSGFSTTNTYIYTADRFWVFSGTSTTYDYSQVTSIGLAGFNSALRAQRRAGNTGTLGVFVGQIIETLNCVGLAGNTVTLSFYARAGANFSSGSNVLSVQFWTGSGTDQGLTSLIQQTWTSQANASSVVTLTTSWQRFTVTFSVPSGATEISIGFNAGSGGTAGANDYFDLTGVQLEVGSVATPFERRQYEQELALCLRYYWAAGNSNGGPKCITTEYGRGLAPTPIVPMRATPSISATSLVRIEDGSTMISNPGFGGIFSDGSAWTTGVTTALYGCQFLSLKYSAEL